MPSLSLWVALMMITFKGNPSFQPWRCSLGGSTEGQTSLSCCLEKPSQALSLERQGSPSFSNFPPLNFTWVACSRQSAVGPTVPGFRRTAFLLRNWLGSREGYNWKHSPGFLVHMYRELEIVIPGVQTSQCGVLAKLCQWKKGDSDHCSTALINLQEIWLYKVSFF